MRIIRDGILLCADCMFYHETGDPTSFWYYYGTGADQRQKEVETGLDKLGPYLVAAWDSETGAGHHEFTWRGCDCCGSKLGGEKWEYAQLGA